MKYSRSEPKSLWQSALESAMPLGCIGEVWALAPDLFAILTLTNEWRFLCPKQEKQFRSKTDYALIPLDAGIGKEIDEIYTYLANLPFFEPDTFDEAFMLSLVHAKYYDEPYLIYCSNDYFVEHCDRAIKFQSLVILAPGVAIGLRFRGKAVACYLSYHYQLDPNFVSSYFIAGEETRLRYNNYLWGFEAVEANLPHDYTPNERRQAITDFLKEHLQQRQDDPETGDLSPWLHRAGPVDWFDEPIVLRQSDIEQLTARYRKLPNSA